MKKTFLLTLMAVLPFCLAAQLPSYLPANGLMGWWPFNGNANDESGNGNNGTVNGATLVSDRFGNANKAFSFNGVKDHIIIINNTIGNFQTSDFTISCWIHDTNSVNGGALVSKRNAYGWGNFFSMDWENGPFIELNQNNSSDYYVYRSDLNLLNKWHNYVFVRFGNRINIYVNSDLIFSNNLALVHNINNSANMTFGARYALTDLTEFINAKLDDIGIWNRALSQQEINALYISSSTNNGGANNANTNVPQGINYQAVARNAQGIPMVNMNISVKFTLLADSISGLEEYSETHSVTTNNLGLFNLIFGNGTPIKGNFSGIKWAFGNKFIKVEINAGNEFSIMSTQQLMSVPYAQHSNTTKTLMNKDLPVYSNNIAAISGGLQPGQIYRNETGDLKIVY